MEHIIPRSLVTLINYSISLTTGAYVSLFQNCTEPFIRWYGVIQFYT